MEMSAKLCVLMVLLIFSDCARKAGVKGDVTPTVFSSAGGHITLHCNNVLDEDCFSTTWIYNSAGHDGTTEEVGHGQVKQDSPTNRSKRLMVESDCSLNITDVTTEDAGLYTCQQFPKEGGQKEGGDAPVYLAVLQMFASPEVTEIEPGSKVTLQCLLITHDKCGGTVENKRVSLSWVDKQNMKLNETSNRHIRTSSACNITIAEKLIHLKRSEKLRLWTCQLTADGKVKASTTYTIRVKDSKSTSAFPTILVASTSTSETITDSTTTPSLILKDHTVSLIVGALVASLLSAIIVIVVICKKRANSERRTQNNVDDNISEMRVNESEQPPANDQNTEHYASIKHLNQAHTKHARKSPVDTVIYSTLRDAVEAKHT
ncbi:uncharacterized protein LOC121712031 isoform X1 [Alosa sapidissima]|uniref:uncharacterized protein LOC121712031 isoform X1 n=1 Tax=Alosa sapidissima TaxID=34773 RepID=UPI001C083191|nr:uncharacterized protein LOC121712031 isoform X1 [Alosa sapidissima]